MEDVPEAVVAPFQVPLLYDIDTSDQRVFCPGNRGQYLVYTDYTEVVDCVEINVLRATFTSSLSDNFRHYFLDTRRESALSFISSTFEQNRSQYDRENNTSGTS